MSVLSKIQQYEKIVDTKRQISQVVVGAAVGLYLLKVTYPWLSSSFASKKKPTPKDNEPSSQTEEYSEEEIKLQKAEKLLAELNETARKKNQPNLNLEFLHQMKNLVKIMIPRFLCYETGILAVHTVSLISRTFLSIYVASLEGALVKFIVRKDVKQFSYMLLKWFGIAIPATFINSMIRYLENKLALAFRTRLVRHSYRLYFHNQNYYRVANLDARIENADHR